MRNVQVSSCSSFRQAAIARNIGLAYHGSTDPVGFAECVVCTEVRGVLPVAVAGGFGNIILRACPGFRDSDPCGNMGARNAAGFCLEMGLSRLWTILVYQVVGGGGLVDDFTPAELEVKRVGVPMSL